MKLVILLLVLLAWLLSCNQRASYSEVDDSKKTITLTSDVGFKKKYINEYSELELELISVEITKREKLRDLYLLTREYKTEDSSYNNNTEPSELTKLKLEIQQISVDSNRLFNKMKAILQIIPLTEIEAFQNVRHQPFKENDKTVQKCSDQRSYDNGYKLAADQIGKGLMADCNYLFEFAQIMADGLDHFCFCKGVNDWSAQHQR